MPGGRLAAPPRCMTREAGEADAILAGVSRETRAALDLYVAELGRWQRIKNLVGPRTLAKVWTRHVADSLQLAPLAEGEVWVDLGTGAGFPGLVLALARPGTFMHLVESDGRKCAFLRHVVRLTGAPARVWNDRAESVMPLLDPRPGVVVARALAALPDLLDLSQSLLTTGVVGLFPKGRGYAAELTGAAECWRFDADVIPSRVDPDGRIIRIRAFEGRQKRQPGEPS